MGILDENLDDLLENCKQTAEIALLSVKEHAENLDRNFEEIMNLGREIQSLRLSAFLAGYLGKVVHNAILPDMIGWRKGAKIDTTNRAIQDLMTGEGYKSFNLEKMYEDYYKNSDRLHRNLKKDLSFHEGGVIVANRALMNDRTNTLHNLTIFLDTLVAVDGQYINGVSYKNGELGNDLSNINSQ